MHRHIPNILCSFNKRCMLKSYLSNATRNIASYPQKMNLHRNGTALCQSSKYFLQPPQVFAVQQSSFFKEKQPPNQDPNKGKLVYVGTITNMVRNVKLFSLSTSILGICLQPVLYTKAAASTLPFWLKIFMSGFMNFFVFATPAMLHFVTKRYITHMYYDENSGYFTATKLTFFVNDKDFEFTKEQVDVPDVPGVFGTIRIDGKPYFIDQSMFLDNDVYIKLMGYDQPIDWSFDDKILEGMQKTDEQSKDKKV